MLVSCAQHPRPQALPCPPLIPLNILDETSFAVRNNNTTSFAYIGRGDGTTPPEQY